MNYCKQILAIACVILLAGVCSARCYAQLVVNGRNLNEEKDLQYIQLMYYLDKATLGPVFAVDFGYIEPEYHDILEPERHRVQHIRINGHDVTDRVTAVWVLNQMHKAGWEYLGDAVYVPLRSLNNWHIFTLKRKPTHANLVVESAVKQVPHHP